jgi:hypothetical protein
MERSHLICKMNRHEKSKKSKNKLVALLKKWWYKHFVLPQMKFSSYLGRRQE